MKLEITNQSDYKHSEELFTFILGRLDSVHKGVTAERMELLLTDNENIRQYNKQYRGKDTPTDVLSFTLDGEHGENLGQIIISVERAAEQAKEIGQSLDDEIQFLFTHGVLHLLGYDHEEPDEEKIMLEKAYTLLGRNGRE